MSKLGSECFNLAALVLRVGHEVLRMWVMIRRGSRRQIEAPKEGREELVGV